MPNFLEIIWGEVKIKTFLDFWPYRNLEKVESDS